MTTLRSGWSAPVVAFDIGGTHFRSALAWPDGTGQLHLGCLRTAPTDTYLTSAAATQADLRQALLARIVSTVDELSAVEQVSRAGVSLGAAIDARTGIVIGSGPIFGVASEPFDLPALLAVTRPEITWAVVNDISAAAWHYAAGNVSTLRRLAVMVVGSGIGMRTIVPSTMQVPVGARHGLQGEIGHLRTTFRVGDVELDLICDCGGRGHLGAYVSGNGLARVWRQLRPPDTPLALPEALRLGTPRAFDVLDALAMALADTIAWVLTVDADIDRLHLIGGVIRGIGMPLVQRILGRLEDGGMYQITERAPDFFRSILQCQLEPDNSELLGAARIALHGP